MSALKLHLVSLGCDKNLVDSEKMLGLALKKGYELTDSPSLADVIVVNTCAFIRDALEESISVILDMASYNKKLIVTGCLAERYRDEIRKEIPEVFEVIGVSEVQKIFFEEHVKERVLSTGGHYAHLKIAEGCNKRCTYCIIPFLRGTYRSVPMEDIVEEAKELAEGGVKELILVAQETSVYGMDIYGQKMLPELLRELSNIDGIEWIRIQYCYPEEITDELIETIAELPKVCHYLDMPIQHASDHILRRMGRATNLEDLRKRVRKLREVVPDIALRTTVMTGFPGETEKDHETLISFIKEARFERLGCFEYSKEEGTKAADFSHQIAKKVKAERKDEIMLTQQKIVFENTRALVGRTMRVMIEGRLPEEGVYVGRSYMDAPDIDGLIYIEKASGRDFMSGDFVNVKITASSGYDLTGELI